MSGAYSNVATETQVTERLYDYVAPTGIQELEEHIADQTMQSVYCQGDAFILNPNGQGITAVEDLDGIKRGGFFVLIENLIVGETVYLYPGYYMAPSVELFQYQVVETGELITKPFGEQMSFIATATTHQVFVFIEHTPHQEIQFYNFSALTLRENTGSCTAFIRIVGVGDFTLDGVTPYTVVGEVRDTCPSKESDCCEESKSILTQISNSATQVVNNTTPRAAASLYFAYATEQVIAHAGYLSLSVTFENEGTINGQYVPAGYSFSHEYNPNGYSNAVTLDGTSYMIWVEGNITSSAAPALP